MPNSSMRVSPAARVGVGGGLVGDGSTVEEGGTGEGVAVEVGVAVAAGVHAANAKRTRTGRLETIRC